MMLRASRVGNALNVALSEAGVQALTRRKNMIGPYATEHGRGYLLLVVDDRAAEGQPGWVRGWPGERFDASLGAHIYISRRPFDGTYREAGANGSFLGEVAITLDAYDAVRQHGHADVTLNDGLRLCIRDERGLRHRTPRQVEEFARD